MSTIAKPVKKTNNVVNCGVQWTDKVTKLLLAEMQKNTESFVNQTNLFGKLSKNIWKNIAASTNTHGYNLTAENCYIKWTGIKTKYKTIKNATKTGAAKQTWEYFNIITDMLGKNPIITPLSIASNIRGFTINQNVSDSLDEEDCESEQNKLNVASTNVLQNKQIRTRKLKTSVWMEKLIEQRERHHQENLKRAAFIFIRKAFQDIKQEKIEKYLKSKYIK